MQRAPVGIWTIRAGYDGTDLPWILDTGANYSVVSETTAKLLKLAVLNGGTSTGTSTSRRIAIRYAVVPALTIGQATIHDLVVLVIADEALHVRAPKLEYQMQAILGINAFRMFGRSTFDDVGTFRAGSAAGTVPRGGALLMNERMPLLVAQVNGANLVFNLDTGANVTTFFSPYADRFARERAAWRPKLDTLIGAGGTVSYQVMTQPQVRFKLDGRETVMKNVSIFTGALGDEPDSTYGNLGVDLLNRFHQFTFDFSTMRYAVGAPTGKTQTDAGNNREGH